MRDFKMHATCLMGFISMLIVLPLHAQTPTAARPGLEATMAAVVAQIIKYGQIKPLPDSEDVTRRAVTIRLTGLDAAATARVAAPVLKIWTGASDTTRALTHYDLWVSEIAMSGDTVRLRYLTSGFHRCLTPRGGWSGGTVGGGQMGLVWQNGSWNRVPSTGGVAGGTAPCF